MVLACCALVMVGEMSQNRSLRCLKLESGTTSRALGQLDKFN